ncbi:mitochondrial intermembrane space import and assembly protein 40-like, partial [Triplophysa rosa]|uniref:mitochondrial intermembrane space import and assembly protein 40-like n=1 Tax=Triplophysa rosa TaxID=992332 RepID=UPI0025463636
LQTAGERCGFGRRFAFPGKDHIIFVTKEDHEAPSNAELIEDDPNDSDEDHGLILPNGEINWNFPCLGGMVSGPCGQQFKEVFCCFYYSKEEVKGSDCVENLRSFQECMQKYPELYPQEDDKDSAPLEGLILHLLNPLQHTVPSPDSESAVTENPAAS